ncbi:tellurite resistance TerB family protein [Epilithonimonas tenax]|uniref:tellurite resistance TerB family protein n=1 Tax=Epilithonimonas tenax TaxID=191577 RepID=UPI000403D479|nr:TerB family tellurite resistance protein [Epilithonimonas tenax]
MRKSNKPIAGYHLLMILSAVDGIMKPQEGLKIQEYMAEEFPFRLDLDDELETIAQLTSDQWQEHFEFHAKCYEEDSTETERKDFIQFAKSLIKADNKVSDDEHKFYILLKNLWNLK